MKSKNRWRIVAIAAATLGLLCVAPAWAADWSVSRNDDWCHHDEQDDRYCEVREAVLPADRDVIAVDGLRNGGIRIEGWDRGEILLRAKVQLWDRSGEDSRDLAPDVEILTDGETIHATGPPLRDRSGWAVSYHLQVPRQSNLSLQTTNGGIRISGVHGDIDFNAKNGGLHLSGLGGSVRGRTSNGGLHVELEGDRWDGEGLDVVTTNGGVDLVMPEDYSAELVTGTVNGRLEIDFPVTVQGTVGKRIETTIGTGGATVSALTTNGGVTVRKR